MQLSLNNTLWTYVFPLGVYQNNQLRGNDRRLVRSISHVLLMEKLHVGGFSVINIKCIWGIMQFQKARRDRVTLFFLFRQVTRTNVESDVSFWQTKGPLSEMTCSKRKRHWNSFRRLDSQRAGIVSSWSANWMAGPIPT